MREYLGIPYQDKGRDKKGLDCWGLCMLVASNEFNYSLPSLEEFYTSSLNEFSASSLINKEKETNFTKQENYKAGDVCVFSVGGFACHVGMFIGDNSFIHILGGSNVTIECLDSILWSRRLEGVYRKCTI